MFFGKWPEKGPFGENLTDPRAGTFLTPDGKRFALTEHRGDWSFMKWILGFRSSWKAGTTAPVCYRCSAWGKGPPATQYFHVGENATTWATELPRGLYIIIIIIIYIYIYIYIYYTQLLLCFFFILYYIILSYIILYYIILYYIISYYLKLYYIIIVYYCYTSSTAQGGGGSFKNRKPIGEAGCCESGMAERSHWWNERCLRSPLFLSLSLTIYLPMYLSIYLSIYRSIYLSIDRSIDLSIFLSIYLSLSLSFI